LATVTSEREPAVRYVSDQVVSTRVAALAFEVEALTDAGPFGVPAGGAPRALEIAHQLETLAGEIAGERPSMARMLRTAANDMRRGADAPGPLDAFTAFTEALGLLEQL
jgi:hypothetical protein